DVDATRGELSEILAHHSRVWLVLWAVRESDPDGVVEGWLDDHAFKSSEQWFGSVRLAVYSAPAAASPGAAPGPPERPLEMTFGDRIGLAGYSLRAPGAAAAVTAGEALQLTLYWRALAPVEESLKVFTHIVDAKEHLWGQRDAEPGSGRRPTSGWTAGETVVDPYGVPVLPGTPPGVYQVEVGLYRPTDGSRLTFRDAGGATAGDRLLLGPIEVRKPATPPSVEALPSEHRRTERFGPLL